MRIVVVGHPVVVAAGAGWVAFLRAAGWVWLTLYKIAALALIGVLAGLVWLALAAAVAIRDAHDAERQPDALDATKAGLERGLRRLVTAAA